MIEIKERSKGVSPVVAVVLLIAIAVISAVAVWYWVAPLTARPSTGGDISKSIAVTQCFTGWAYTTVSVRNTGGVIVQTTIFGVFYNDNGSQVLNNSGATVVARLNGSLASGATATLNVSGSTGTVDNVNLSTSTAYFLRVSGIPDAPFSC